MNARNLRWLAIPFALLAISNFTKPLQMTDEVGFVLLGRRLAGTANLLAGPAMGVFLAAYARSIWKGSRMALVLGLAYAAWVPLNIYLFTVRSPEELGTNSLFGLAYTVVAVGVSGGAAVLLWRSRESLS